MGTNCALLFANFLLFCYERAFVSDNNQADVVDPFNSTSNYLDDWSALCDCGIS